MKKLFIQTLLIGTFLGTFSTFGLLAQSLCPGASSANIEKCAAAGGTLEQVSTCSGFPHCGCEDGICCACAL